MSQLKNFKIATLSHKRFNIRLARLWGWHFDPQGHGWELLYPDHTEEHRHCRHRGDSPNYADDREWCNEFLDDFGDNFHCIYLRDGKWWCDVRHGDGMIHRQNGASMNEVLALAWYRWQTGISVRLVTKTKATGKNA